MAETPPSPSLQSQGKKPGESKAEEAHEEGGRITSNGGQASSSSMPFAGEMERRGEEKVRRIGGSGKGLAGG
jgi:hypothetical protein